MKLFGFIDHLMRLPEGLDQTFRYELAKHEKEKKMPYVTSIERLAIKEGMEMGIEKGLVQGRITMARESVVEALGLRFGPVPASMKARIEGVLELEQCRLLLQAAITAESMATFEGRLDALGKGG